MGTLVGALVGVFVGPLVGSNFAVRVLWACLMKSIFNLHLLHRVIGFKNIRPELRSLRASTFASMASDSENSRRLWLFLGSVREFWRKVPGNSGKIAGKIFPNHEMLQILGFRAPGKANLPGTLGPHCRDLVPTFLAGCFLKSAVPAFSSFSE